MRVYQYGMTVYQNGMRKYEGSLGQLSITVYMIYHSNVSVIQIGCGMRVYQYGMTVYQNGMRKYEGVFRVWVNYQSLCIWYIIAFLPLLDGLKSARHKH